MAAQALLLVRSSHIHAEFIHEAGWYHRFDLDHTADFCSVYSWTAEGKQLLWNSSGSYYELDPLKVSHSGQYLQQCWTRGSVTLERNATLLVCDTQKMTDQFHGLYPDVGQTVELTCDGVGPNQSIHWGYDMYRLEGLALMDDDTPLKYEHRLVKNRPSLLLTANKPSLSVSFYCLEKKLRWCELHSRFFVYVPPEFIFRSVGESLELNCSDGSRNQTHMWRKNNALKTDRESLNSTLWLPSLTLNHTGSYTCELGDSAHGDYFLFVCPEPEPPAVEHFNEGENLTLHCGDWNQTDNASWFMRSNRTKGRVANFHQYRQTGNVSISHRGLMIRNVSLEEPELDHHLLRSVLLGLVMLMMLCVVVVVMVWRRSRREQRPAPVEELEMSQLPPESDVQEATRT